MSLAGLFGFITAMWLMVLGVAAFLIAFVAPIEIRLFGSGIDRVVISAVQAVIAIVIVGILIIALSRMKERYIQKRLRF